MTPAPSRPRAALVAVGNELLLGQTVDTNSAWLGRTLADWGFDVTRGTTVPDDDDAIRDAVSEAAGAAELVVVTGGLGPTADDRTKVAVAALLGVDLVRDETVLADVRRHFAASGREVPTLSHGQADVPTGALPLRNPVGTAPGLLLEGPTGATIVLVPGVPREMRAIVSEGLRGELARAGRLGPSARHRVIHTAGVPESRLAELVAPRWDALPDSLRENVSLAYLPDEIGVDLRITARGLDERSADERLGRVADALAADLGAWRYESETGDLAEAVGSRLRARGLRIATAESCTGGLLAERLTALPGASDYYRGSIIAYDNEVKRSQLGVPAAMLEAHGAVSEPVAERMALGVAERLAADVGVGITGVAGPAGGGEEKPVGTVWIAVVVRDEVRAWRSRFGGDRGAVRRRAAQAALLEVHRRLDQP